MNKLDMPLGKGKMENSITVGKAARHVVHEANCNKRRKDTSQNMSKNQFRRYVRQKTLSENNADSLQDEVTFCSQNFYIRRRVDYFLQIQAVLAHLLFIVTDDRILAAECITIDEKGHIYGRVIFAPYSVNV